MAYRTLLVDLDGTLVDTAPDMGAALNALRRAHGRDALDAAQIRPHVSHGAAGLVRLGFADVPAAEHAPLREQLVQFYATALTTHGTALFDGFAAVLARLAGAGHRWGIVTNKPAWLTDPLLATLSIMPPPAVVISGDTTAERKPHPLPIRSACEVLGVEPAQCLYVGDAERDIVAGRAAGMATALAAWGYHAAADDPTGWAATHHLATPADLLPLFGIPA